MSTPQFFHQSWELYLELHLELHCLEQQGVIEPVTFSENPASVEKDVTVQICGDYKMTVNHKN